MAGNCSIEPALAGALPCAGAFEPRSAWRRWIAVAAVGCLLGACTVVRVRDAEGVRVSYYPGVAVVQVRTADATRVVEVKSFGLAVVADQFTLGWLDSQTALIPPGRCQLIMLRAHPAAVAELRELLGPRTELCTQEGEQ